MATKAPAASITMTPAQLSELIQAEIHKARTETPKASSVAVSNQVACGLGPWHPSSWVRAKQTRLLDEAGQPAVSRNGQPILVDDDETLLAKDRTNQRVRQIAPSHKGGFAIEITPGTPEYFNDKGPNAKADTGIIAFKRFGTQKAPVVWEGHDVIIQVCVMYTRPRNDRGMSNGVSRNGRLAALKADRGIEDTDDSTI